MIFQGDKEVLLNIYCKNRINLGFKDSTLLLDPKVIETTVGCIFISHAHSDHLPVFRKKPSFIPPVVCSQATARLFYERIGYKLPQQTSWKNNDTNNAISETSAHLWIMSLGRPD